MKRYDIALFDLDGTLSESGEGILDCVKIVFEEMQRPLPDEKTLASFIGPPLTDSLKRCGFSEKDAEKGLQIYKKNFVETGIYKNKAYDGITEALQALKENGILLGVATTKYQPFADKIIKMLKLDGYFDFVGGSSGTPERHTKIQVIEYVLDNLGRDKKAVMIGDTKFDAEGAYMAKVDFIGCLYGYGTREEMEKYFPGTILVTKPSEIVHIIISD